MGRGRGQRIAEIGNVEERQGLLSSVLKSVVWLTFWWLSFDLVSVNYNLEPNHYLYTCN